MLQLADAWVHDLDPYMIQLWEGGPIRWYGMAYLLGFFVAYRLIRRYSGTGISTLRPAEAADFVTTLAIAVVIGSRVGYVVFYKPSLLGFSDSFPFWDMLAFHKGGMSAHGGVLGLLAGTIFLSRRYRHRWAHLGDICAFAGAIGITFGRLANFINGELFGRIAKPGELLYGTAIKFPTEMTEWTDPAKFQQLAANLEAGGVAVPEGLQSTELVMWTIARIQDKLPGVADAAAPLLNTRYPSQLFQGLLEGISAWVIVAILARKPQKPGLLTGAWLAAYSVFRFIAEFWREPDGHIKDMEFAAIGLSRGQLLCVAMFVCGIAVMAWFGRTDAPKMGGWLKVSDEERKAWTDTDGASERYCGPPPDEDEDEGSDPKDAPASS
ncbi:MAG: prolipoprotein diacylglyceryl transferase [Planctomycetes bacterium]|nr:prolipoprotein diacylglyceryl transferase [Planctomycetota bacterium]